MTDKAILIINILISPKTVTSGLNAWTNVNTIERVTVEATSPNLSINDWKIIPLKNISSWNAKRNNWAVISNKDVISKYLKKLTSAPNIIKNMIKNKKVDTDITMIFVRFLRQCLSKYKPNNIDFEFLLNPSINKDGIRTIRTTVIGYING